MIKLVVHYLRIQKMGSEQPSALAYILHFYKLHRLYILEKDLGILGVWEHQKVVRYIANTGRECQFWLIFRIKLIQCKLLVYILGIVLRVVYLKWNC